MIITEIQIVKAEIILRLLLLKVGGVFCLWQMAIKCQDFFRKFYDIYFAEILPGFMYESTHLQGGTTHLSMLTTHLLEDLS